MTHEHESKVHYTIVLQMVHCGHTEHSPFWTWLIEYADSAELDYQPEGTLGYETPEACLQAAKRFLASKEH
jgi:hypothetical protein